MKTKPTRKIVVDPVCEMDVKVAQSPGVSFSGRRTYYFCSMQCKQEFDRDPEFYVRKIARAAVESRNREGLGKSKGRRALHRRTTSRPSKATA